jgi:hypothetical protein
MNTVVALLSVSALIITTGCGDEATGHYPEAPPETGQAEFAILSADLDSHYRAVEVSDLLAVDIDSEERNSMMAAIHNDLSVTDLEELELDINLDIDAVPDAPPVASQLNLESQGPVCARTETWKEFSHKTCTSFGGRLSAIAPSNQCAEEHYAGMVFQCIFEDSHGDVIKARKFESFTLGGRSTCKPYEAFADFAASICDGAENIREKHILGSCDRFGSEEGFSAVRFTCEI